MRNGGTLPQYSQEKSFSFYSMRAKNDKQENSGSKFPIIPIPIPLALSVSRSQFISNQTIFSHLLPYYKCRYYKSAGHRVSKPAIYPLKSYADVANKPAHCPYSIPLQPQDLLRNIPHRNKAHPPRQHQTPLSKKEIGRIVVRHHNYNTFPHFIKFSANT